MKPAYCTEHCQVAQKTENVSGSKKAMDHISVMFCCNMTGTHKLTPLVIGHSRNPRCFRGQRVPLPWESNKKAWMTAAIFREWEGAGRRLCFSCTAHPHDIPLENIRLVFLPANTTSLIQPLDQGIIRNFKGLYRAQMLRRVISAVDNDEIDNAQKFAKTTTVLDALFMVREAWKGVKDVTVQVREARGSTTDESPDDNEEELPPPPSLRSVNGALDIVRRWMQYWDHRDYSKFIDIDGNIQRDCLSKRKQKNITDFSENGSTTDSQSDDSSPFSDNYEGDLSDQNGFTTDSQSDDSSPFSHNYNDDPSDQNGFTTDSSPFSHNNEDDLSDQNGFTTDSSPFSHNNEDDLSDQTAAEDNGAGSTKPSLEEHVGRTYCTCAKLAQYVLPTCSLEVVLNKYHPTNEIASVPTESKYLISPCPGQINLSCAFVTTNMLFALL
ncbi:Pyruvate decarboxylase 2 [Branchiostoma belcheri]|nr:Pyruvate decarboxylase 2 [Branchiostoma belcheri]